MRAAAIAFCLVVSAVCLQAQGPQPRPIESAYQLYRAGDNQEAFLAYLAIPGGEFVAARIGRAKPAAYLALLGEKGGGTLAPSRKLVEGDLLLAQGKRAEALTCYREAASRVGKTKEEGWDQGVMPADYYPVEPALISNGFDGGSDYAFRQEALPFSFGPGSHRDNWLIRRFIALEAWDDAGREFARIWALHQQSARPHEVIRPVYHPDTETTTQETVTVNPPGYNGLGLEFALDYAYFLRRQNDVQGAVAVLMAPLLVMDMDRNPELVDGGFGWRRGWGWGASAGISRKEYVRLVYGEMKTLGKENELVAALQGQIAGGDNRARRVLARVRGHQGDPEGALALELVYLDAAGLDPLSTAYRKGLAYEAAQKLSEAVQQYEKALALPYSPPRLPDADEETTQGEFQSQVIMVAPNPLSSQGRASFQQEVLARLQRLCGALDKPQEVFDLTLRQFELNEASLENLPSLQDTAARFKAAGQGDRFIAWAKAQAAQVTMPLAKANLCWVLQDYQGTLQAVVKLAAADPRSTPAEEWKQRFREVGRAQIVALLTALVEANPKDARSRLELLDLTDHFEGPQAVQALETLLDSDASWAFAYGKGFYQRTQFRDYFDLAYRLMRLYEKAGQGDKMVALGFRLLEGDKPFKRPEQDAVLPTPRDDWNDWGERAYLGDLLNAVYVMLPHVKQPTDLARLQALVDKTDCIPLKNQVARLTQGEKVERLDPAGVHSRHYPGVTVRTPGLPAGVRLLSNRDDVRAVSPDGQWVGTSWGLVRYRAAESGALEVLQIPLGTRVSTFLSTPAGLFLGTRAGLYKLENSDGPAPRPVYINIGASSHASQNRPPSVGQLLWWKSALWIKEEDGSSLWRYDPGANEVRQWGEVDGKLLVADGRLWTGYAVYDEKQGSFTRLSVDAREWQIIGATSKEIWADVWVNDKLRHRPALVDPDKLTVKVLPLTTVGTGDGMLVNRPFEVLAEDQDHVWLLGESIAPFEYSRLTGETRLVISPEVPQTPRGPAVWRSYEGGQFFRFYCGTATRMDIPGLILNGDRGPYFSWQERTDGTLLLGSAIVREWQEDNMGSDDDEGMSQHVQDLEGGLFVVQPDTLRWEKLGAPDEELSDFYVKRIVFDDAADQAYVCTNGGVTVLSLPEGKPVGRITVSDGLPSNKVEDVARIGDKLYLACELGDAGGGLAVRDLRTGLVNTLRMSDGLGMDKVKRLWVEGPKLHILYGTAYAGRMQAKARRWVEVPGNNMVVTCPSSVLDTTTGVFTDGTELWPAATAPDPDRRIPYLGGSVLVDETHRGKRYLGGTHGLLVVEPEAKLEPALNLASVVARPVLSQQQRWLADLETRQPRPVSRAELARDLQDDNLFYRAEALAALLGRGDEVEECFDLIAGQLSNPEVRVRSTALYLIAQRKDNGKVVPLLKERLADSDRTVRGFAALELARRGVLPPLTVLREISGAPDGGGNYPFGAKSSLGLQADAERLLQAVALVADREVFALLLEGCPPAKREYGGWPATFAALGASLCKHPDAVPVLLATQDPERVGKLQFVQDVFKAAGKEMLPVLQEALTSNDRVVRSNAARACGAIGDASSIPALINVLDLESGLARASIVWALGELKAADALPALAKLYVDVSTDERRGAGAGFRFAQSQAAMGAQYASLTDLAAIGTEWNELTVSSLQEPLDPREQENLLKTSDILTAVAKIGTSAGQEFYRTLAGGRDEEAREQAAAALAQGGPEDRAKNLAVLQSLSADPETRVRIAAIVSLHLLGEKGQEPQLRQLLASRDNWVRVVTVGELLRVEDGKKLAFARDLIEALSKDSALYTYGVVPNAQTLLKRISAAGQ
jgi:HEAT repeat protein/tetratricopeptide (TPR) repeat protein